MDKIEKKGIDIFQFRMITRIRRKEEEIRKREENREIINKRQGKGNRIEKEKKKEKIQTKNTIN